MKTTDKAATDPIWQRHAADRPDWWRPLAPNPWPGNPNVYECPWGCNGTGNMPWFSHIANGVCFGCHGNGWILGRGLSAIPRKTSRQAPRQARQWRREGGRIVQA